MGFRSFKFAWNNLKANRLYTVPYILAMGLLYSLFFIMDSLRSNDFVQTRHAAVSDFMTIGIVVIVAFIIALSIYAYQLLMKNRNREFALYSVLGLEKRHVASILFMEHLYYTIFISGMSIILGYILGKFSFLVLAKVMDMEGWKLAEYPFSGETALRTLAFVGGSQLILYAFNVVRVSLASPVELFRAQKKSQKEPRVKWLILVLGLLSLGGGYYLALTVKGVAEAVVWFLVAVILVIIGTYCLFSSLSISVLKALKRRPSYYKKPERFISVSGMLYRMNSHAMGLASIAIMGTSIILTVATTLAINRGLNQSIESAIPRDSQLQIFTQETLERSEEDFARELGTFDTALRELRWGDLQEEDGPLMSGYRKQIPKELGKDAADEIAQVKEALSHYDPGELVFSAVDSIHSFETYAYFEDDILKAHMSEPSTEDRKAVFLTLKYQMGGIPLPEDAPSDIEFLSTASRPDLRQPELTIAGKVMRGYDQGALSSALIGGDSLELSFLNYEDYARAVAYYVAPELLTVGRVSYRLVFDMDMPREAEAALDYFTYAIPELADAAAGELESTGDVEVNYSIFTTRESMYRESKELNGGFIFLGILVSMIFLVGSILVTYYKQISEAFEDQSQFLIMQQVGLSEELIRKTSNQQIVWMFFLPLIVAVVHCLFASKILNELLQGFGVSSPWTFLRPLGLMILIYAAAYYLIFLLTSRVYNRIVRQGA